MLRLTALLLAIAAGCAPDDGVALRYLDDARFRRATLVASLVNPANGYSRLRLGAYATGQPGDWDALPAWNPLTVQIDADGNQRGEAMALDLAAARDPASRLALGERAFYRYPVQLVAAPVSGAAQLRALLADGSWGSALSCASCHSRVVDGVVVPGLANEAIDVGSGPGLVDVAPPPGETPVAIPDLRPVALETHLQRDGAVRNDGLAALAVRIETLIITSHGAQVRPPREVPLALAAWLRSLAPPPPSPLGGRGAELFTARCASCHAPPAYAGPPVPLAEVRTDPRVGLSADRGTGGYRVPSLRGVTSRGRLLHDGSIADVAQLLDPMRSVKGHPFALDLPADDRAALATFLASL
jgi:mono/diheme cytochrome c family protein